MTEIKINTPQNIPQPLPGEINFGKIILLSRDPLIEYIECVSEGQGIIIKKAGQTIKTQITLTKEEIVTIIKDFSEKTRIPLIEGMLNARYGTFEISAIVSDIISPSFIIRKNITSYTRPPNQFLRR